MAPLIALALAVLLGVTYLYAGTTGFIIVASATAISVCSYFFWISSLGQDVLAFLYIGVRYVPNETHMINSFQWLKQGFDGTAADRRAENLFFTGYQAWYSNHLGRAVHYLKKALSATENRRAQARIYYILSRCESDRKNRTPQALAAIRESARLDARFEAAWCEWVRLLNAQGERTAAVSRCTEGLVYNPQSLLLLNQRAALWLDSGDFSAALRDAKTAFELDPQDPEALIQGALACAGLGRDQEARFWYNAAAANGDTEGLQAARERMEALLEQKNGKTFSLPAYTGVFVLESEYQTYERCTAEELRQALDRFFADDVTFITLRPPAPVDRILFIQATIVDGRISLNIGLEESGRCRIYERASSRTAAEQIFGAFLQGEIAFDPDAFHAAQL